MDKKYIIALEFSGSQVKGAAAVLGPSAYARMGLPRIETIACDEKADCVKYGRIHNIMDAYNAASFVIQKLENIPSLQDADVVSAFVGLAGRSLGSLSATAEIALPSEMQIDEDILKKLHLEATKAVPGDKMVLKVLPRKYYVDNQECQNAVGALGSNLRGDFTIVTCNAANRSNLERVVKERMGLQVQEYVITPLTVGDMVLSEEEKQLGCVLVDVGKQTTSVSVYKDRALQYLATLPLGSNHITLDLSSGLGLTRERAEMAKCTQADAMFDQGSATSEDEALMACYVQARLGEIVANVAAQISYAGFKESELTKGIVLTGRGSKLDNFDKFVKSRTKMNVRLASIPQTVTFASREVVPTDFTSLVSIVAYAASLPDLESCVAFPVKGEDVSGQPGGYFDLGGDAEPRADKADDTDDSDDESWRYDDEEVERRNAIKERDKQERAEKDAAAERKERERLERQQREAQEKAERAAAKSKKASKSILAKLKATVVSMMDYDPSKGDEDLDETSDLK